MDDELGMFLDGHVGSSEAGYINIKSAGAGSAGKGRAVCVFVCVCGVQLRMTLEWWEVTDIYLDINVCRRGTLTDSGGGSLELSEKQVAQ